ncbi:hypothetical protein [Endozoicomonas sp. 4G]|uniref:RING finger protein n=1 Tax=Endozoicomonas sp. 4G TaxID=2872754 RepID=UPI0020791D19|nr:hypothetical protein [Endozoicomonas sp. 4G]
MTQSCVLKTLLFSVFLFFYQQGLANDTYGLEEFLKHQKESGEPPLKKQKRTNQPDMSPQRTITPLENIRIGFARLNLESDDLSGDDRLETCESYEVAEQDFERLHSLYLNYVNTGDFQYRKVRIQRMLRLMHRMFAININMTHGKSRAERELINEMAESLFDQIFLSEDINGRSNPYYDYFYLYPEEHEPDYADVNHGLALMFLAFLGPHFLRKAELQMHFSSLCNLYTGESYDQAFDSALLSENINEYYSPQGIASQLIVAGLDAETALLIGLAAMASAAFQRMNSGQELQETLETVLALCLPYEHMVVVYNNMVKHCRPERSCCVPGVMYTLTAMEEFTHIIVGIDPALLLPELSRPEELQFLVDYIERSDRAGLDSTSLDSADSDRAALYHAVSDSADSDRAALYHAVSDSADSDRAALYHAVSDSADSDRAALYHAVSDSADSDRAALYHAVSDSADSDRAALYHAVSDRAGSDRAGSDSADSDSDTSSEDSDFKDQHQSIVIQQQNEEIARLRQEVANQAATEQEGAVRGATGVTKKCGVCLKPLQDMMGFRSCEHVGLCQVCIEQIIDEERGCPHCSVRSKSYKKHIDVSH